MATTVLERFEGALLGAACGDALGAWTEELTPSAIRARYQGRLETFPLRPHPYLRDGATYRFTDDTQLTLCVATSLVEHKGFDQEDLARRIVEWFHSADNVRAPARTFMRAAKLLAHGDDVATYGVPSSCGAAASRLTPVGLLFKHDSSRCAHTAAEVARLTHADPCAAAAAVTIARAVSFLADGKDVTGLLTYLRSPLPEGCSEFLTCLATLDACLEFEDEAAFNCIGRETTVYQVVPSALYCLIRHPDDFRRAVVTAVNGGGKADSIASLTGALAGATLGAGAIPPEWLDTLERRDDIRATARRLFDTWQDLSRKG